MVCDGPIVTEAFDELLMLEKSVLVSRPPEARLVAQQHLYCT